MIDQEQWNKLSFVQKALFVLWEWIRPCLITLLVIFVVGYYFGLCSRLSELFGIHDIRKQTVVAVSPFIFVGLFIGLLLKRKRNKVSCRLPFYLRGPLCWPTLEAQEEQSQMNYA